MMVRGPDWFRWGNGQPGDAEDRHVIVCRPLYEAEGILLANAIAAPGHQAVASELYSACVWSHSFNLNQREDD